MAASNTVELVVTVEVDRANRSIRTVNTSFAGMESSVARATAGATRSLNGLEQSAARTSASIRNHFSGIGRAIAGIGVAALAKQTVTIAADFERARLGLEAFLGSADKAKRKFEELQAFAERSPFDFKDLLDASQRLLAFKFSADQLIPTLKGVSSAVAALGGDKGKFQDVITALGQIRNASKLTGEELRQLRNAGLEGAAFDALAKAYGKSVAEIQRMQRDGLIPGLQAAEIIVRGLEEQFSKFDEAVGRSASVAISNFRDSLMRLADDVARDLLPGLTRFLNSFRENVPEIGRHIKAAVDVVRSLADQIVAVGVAFVTYQIVEKVVALTAAVRAFNLASMGTPWGLVAAGIALVGTELYRQNKEWNEFAKIDLQNNAIRQLLKDGKTVADLEKLGYTLEQVKRALSGRAWEGAGPDVRPKDYGIRVIGVDDKPGAAAPPVLGGGGEDVAKYEKRAADILNRARLGELTGVDQVREQYRQYREEIGKTRRAVADLAEAEALDVRRASGKIWREAATDLRKWAADTAKEYERSVDARRKADSEWFEHTIKLNEERARLDLDLSQTALRQIEEIELAREDRVRDARLRGLEAFDAHTLEQKAAVEQRKAEIEIGHLERVHHIRQRLFDLDTSQQALDLELELKRLGYQASEIEQRIAEYTVRREQARQAAQVATDDAIEAARQSAANRTAGLIRDHNRQVFESFKRQAEGVFDALLTKSQSVWSAIGNSLKTALLTAIKEVVTSRVAAMLMQLFTGQRVGFAGSRTGGLFGGVLGGAVPVFAGGGVSPGGTPPFVPSGAAPGAGSGGGGGYAGWGAMAAGYKGWLARMGNIGYGPKGGDFGGEVAGSYRGVGGAKGGAMLLGGSMLALDGLRRGGWTGAAETAAGGALIGWKFGGPLGAAIGASVGFMAGVVRMFVKGALEKAREKIKATYGVDVADKGVLTQIVQTAKSGFGGNLEMAIRSPHVRELIELYAMSTGQKPRGMPGTATPLALAQSGRSLYQTTSYSNGAALPALGGLPTLDRIGGGVASHAGPMVIQLDGPATTALLRGEAVQAIVDNPRAVQSAAMNATRSNAGRREMASLQLSPGLLTA